LMSMVMIAGTMGALTAQIRDQRNKLAERVRTQTSRLMATNAQLKVEIQKREDSQKELAGTPKEE